MTTTANPLKTLLAANAITQAAFASAIGVTNQTVWLWCNDKLSLSQSRAEQVATVLDARPEDFDSMISEKAHAQPHFKFGEPKTMLGWVLQNVWSDGTRDGYHLAVESLAETTGTSFYDVVAWANGDRKIPLEAALRMKDLKFNPALFCYEVEVVEQKTEAEAVAVALKTLVAPPTFAQAKIYLGFWEGEWRDNSLDAVTEANVGDHLDNGEQLNDYLWERAESFRG